MDNGVMLTENALRQVARSIELYYESAPNKDWLVSTCRNAAEQFESMRAELSKLRREQPVRGNPVSEQPDNKPLTLDELRGMDGEPVWLVHDGLGLWAILRSAVAGPCATSVYNVRYYFKDYGKTWLAYHRKPKEEV
jgi:hypothetical protein